MRVDQQFKIYWANAIFTEAQRDFNAKYAKLLREEGYQVFLPQEAPVNKGTGVSSPSAKDIFRVDTSEILNSDLLVACIDQETIDSGVGCEIGIAFAYGIPIIGLYTDIRQYRSGRGQMYKNLYVLGAIEMSGQIVPNIQSLMSTIAQLRDKKAMPLFFPAENRSVSQHFSSVAQRYSGYIHRLESWYEPSWDGLSFAAGWLQEFTPKRIIEIGCGTGNLAKDIAKKYPEIFYLGYDESPTMIEIANSNCVYPNCVFTSSPSVVDQHVAQGGFDLAILFFTLNDHQTPQETITYLAGCLQPNGVVLIADLSTLDLPRITNLLRRGLAKPLYTTDRRLSPSDLALFAKQAKLTISDCRIIAPFVHFPSVVDLEEYFEIFGIYEGMDLPLGLEGSPMERQLIREILEQESFPFTDQRSFISCILKKINPIQES